MNLGQVLPSRIGEHQLHGIGAPGRIVLGRAHPGADGLDPADHGGLVLDGQGGVGQERQRQGGAGGHGQGNGDAGHAHESNLLWPISNPLEPPRFPLLFGLARRKA